MGRRAKAWWANWEESWFRFSMAVALTVKLQQVFYEGKLEGRGVCV